MAEVVDPVYVGIDQSVGGFGLCFYWPASDHYKVWVEKFPLSKYKREVRQLDAVKDFLIRQLGTVPGDVVHVAREGFAYGAKMGREKAGALAYAVDSTLYEWLPDPVCYPDVVAVSHVKEFAAGNGAADKKAIKEAIQRTWRITFNNDNVADAYVIARISHSLHTGNTDNAHQALVIDKIKHPEKYTKKTRAKKKS